MPRKRPWSRGISAGDADPPPAPVPFPLPPQRERPHRVKRIFLYFSEPLATHPVHGIGCITYPVEVVTALVGDEAGQPVVHLLNLPKHPQEMPPGELQVDPAHLMALRAAGYACCAMPAATIDAYWGDARARLVKEHWHPKARLVQY